MTLQDKEKHDMFLIRSDVLSSQESYIVQPIRTQGVTTHFNDRSLLHGILVVSRSDKLGLRRKKSTLTRLVAG